MEGSSQAKAGKALEVQFEMDTDSKSVPSPMKEITNVVIRPDEVPPEKTRQEMMDAHNKFIKWLESLRGRAVIKPGIDFLINYKDGSQEVFDPYETNPLH